MECVQDWAAEDGMRLDPWGIDISSELVALARERLPQWRDQIFVGNAFDWRPPRRYTFVRTSVGYVPRHRGPELLRRLLADVVEPGGRLIVGVYNEETAHTALELAARSWGFAIAGRTERPHPDTEKLVRRAFWIDAPRG
jgi:trans-aconitate methyltransferase